MEVRSIGEPTIESFLLTVNYGLTVEEALKAGGYGHWDEYFNSSNFPHHRIEEKCEMMAVTVLFQSAFTKGDFALGKMSVIGLRPGDIHEMLSLGIQYPEIQTVTTVAALGTSWRDPDSDYLRSPCLDFFEEEREVGTRFTNGDWHWTRFLAFPL